jgi:HprK-related kinase A
VVNGIRPFLPLPANLAGAALEWGLNWCTGTKIHRWITAHAAVVERNGRALVLPAHSGAGKSTLCAALAFSGWRFFSDEFAIIDPDTKRFHPTPRPLSLKNASIELMARRHPHIEYGPEGQTVEGERFVHAKPPSESVRRAEESAAIGWLVFPRYTAGAPTSLEPLPKAHALMEFAGQSHNYNYLPNGYACLAELVGAAECYTLEYSSLDDVLARLMRLTSN